MSLSGRKGALEGTKGGTQLTVAFLPSRQHRTPSAFVHCIRDGRIVRFGIGVQCEREREILSGSIDTMISLLGVVGPSVACYLLPLSSSVWTQPRLPSEYPQFSIVSEHAMILWSPLP